MSIIKYKSHEVDLTKLPEVSVIALATRGLVRLLGSEVASKVSVEFKDTPDADEAAQTTFAEAYRAELLQQLVSGTLGSGRGGPRKDPVEVEMTAIATREIRETLKKYGLKFVRPQKGAEAFEPYVEAGNGERRTMADMLAKRLTDHSDRLRKEAEKVIAAAARQAEKSASIEEAGLF